MFSLYFLFPGIGLTKGLIPEVMQLPRSRSGKLTGQFGQRRYI